MFERILKLMRDKVRSRDYVMTLHAEEEMNEDDLTVYDVEHVILSGAISHRQRDQLLPEWKYEVCGETDDGEGVGLIVKMGATGRLVIITVYRL